MFKTPTPTSMPEQDARAAKVSGRASDTLSRRMNSAIRLIESGGVPPVVVNSRDDDDDDDDDEEADDDDDDDDIGADMLNVVVRRPDPPPPSASRSNPGPDAVLARTILRTVSSAVDGDNATPAHHFKFESSSEASGQDFAKVLQGVSSNMHNEYHTQALRAEIDFKNLIKTIGETETGPVPEILRHAYKASNYLGKEILKYKTVLAWQEADCKKETENRQHTLQLHVATIQGSLADQKKIHRAEIQRLVDAWLSTVAAYRAVLAESSGLLKEMTKGKEASVISESSRIAALLVSAIDDILQETASTVEQTADPQDILRLLATLSHAIEDSTTRVETVLKDCVGTRPDFDEVRHQELEDALSKTRSDITKSKLALSREDDALLTPRLTLDQEYAIRQTQASLRSRLEASARLEALLATDLRDADVQRNITTLHRTCQRQITWKHVGDKLAGMCLKKHEEFKQVYSAAARAVYIEEEVCRKECKDLQDDLREKSQEWRRVLLSNMTAAVAAYVAAVARLSSGGPVTISAEDTAKVKKITANLLSRVLLEYAMLV